MLVKCPECELQVSDKALSCPHCGYPLQQNTQTHKPRSKYNKRRRLPNGFGQISEIKNRNLRKPFRAMVTVGKDPYGKPICKPLKPEAYFETYNDAYAALVEYNKNPYDLSPSITVKELYEQWFKEYAKNVGHSSFQTTENAWTYCSSVYNMRAVDIRPRHIKNCIENGTTIVRGKEVKTSAVIQAKIKSMFNLMLDFALEREIVDRNYARAFKLSKDTVDEVKSVKKPHIPFTDQEINSLWNGLDKVYGVDLILIQCYSGWRPQELGLIRLDDTDIKNWIFQGGIKTPAGKDRVVPIHSRIRPLVERRYNEAVALGSKYIFNYTDPKDTKHGNTLTYENYARCFYAVCEELKLNDNHRPHDGRKHFVTACKKNKVDEYAIKYMVGHAISDITEKVYTQREFTWLKQEIEKLK